MDHAKPYRTDILETVLAVVLDVAKFAREHREDLLTLALVGAEIWAAVSRPASDPKPDDCPF
jgi:hypothetical protein